MFAKINNNQVVTYPYDMDNLLNENPYTAYGPITDFIGVYSETETAQQTNTKLIKVNPSTPPQYDRAIEKLVEVNPEFKDGEWVQSWRVDQLSEEEKKLVYDREAQEVKQKRNHLLQISDWTQLPDSPVDKLLWATYRQLLRDIPQQLEFPFNVVWPPTP